MSVEWGRGMGVSGVGIEIGVSGVEHIDDSHWSRLEGCESVDWEKGWANRPRLNRGVRLDSSLGGE